MNNRLIAAQAQSISRLKQHYVACTAKLDAMSPLKVLTRGYAMMQTENREVVRSVAQANLGDTVHVFVSDGVIDATITNKKEHTL